MKRIDADGNIAGTFTDGNPATGVVATEVDASWLNAVQEELSAVATATGASLDQTNANKSQVLTAIKQLIQDGALWMNFAIGNNQVAAANVTGILLDKTKEYGARIPYHLHRHTDTGGTEVVAMGQLLARYKPQADAWDLTDNIMAGDDHGVTFTITSAGQLQYASTNIGGTNYVGELRISGMTKIRKS